MHTDTWHTKHILSLPEEEFLAIVGVPWSEYDEQVVNQKMKRRSRAINTLTINDEVLLHLLQLRHHSRIKYLGSIFVLRNWQTVENIIERELKAMDEIARPTISPDQYPYEKRKKAGVECYHWLFTWAIDGSEQATGSCKVNPIYRVKVGHFKMWFEAMQ